MQTNRLNTLIKNIFGSFIIKGLSILISFFTIPAYLNYFENETISGVWLTILGMLTWITIFDLGVGNGLRNIIVKYLDNDRYKVKEYVSSAYFILSILCIILIFVGNIMAKFINFNDLFNVKSTIINPKVLDITVTYVFVGILFYFVIKVISSLLLAIEKTTLVNFAQLVTSFLNLIYVLLMKESNSQIALLEIAKFYIFSLNIPYILLSVYMFIFGKIKYIRPTINTISLSKSIEVLTLGSNFFIIQLFLLIINSTNEFLISFLYGPNYVIQYQVYYKIFYLMVTLFSLISNPIWSNIALAWAQKDIQWIIKIRKKLLYLSIMVSLLFLILMIIFPIIVNIWIGDNFNYNIIYGLIFSIFCILSIFQLSSTSIANGIGKLKVQMVCFLCGAIIKIPCVFILFNLGMSWISVVVTNVLILSVFNVFQERALNKLFNGYCS